MTLKSRIIARIRQDGPLTIAEYMTTCLLHPTLGYYTTRDPLGADGDFTTAPEISQMFGELIGLCLAQSWLDQGAPTAFTLAELGPGRGTLMADAMRATKTVPGFHAAARLTLIEASPVLRRAQSERLSKYTPLWLGSCAELPDQPLFLIANEFFDALAIRQFQRDGVGWRERQIGANGDDLRFGLGPKVMPAALGPRLTDTKDGDLVETCAPAQGIISELSRRIARFGGAALLVDYGDWRSQGDTLQAVKGHEPADILDDPGQADLTAHVDFEALALAAKAVGCGHSHLTPQGVFLDRLGLASRAQALANGQTSEVQATITSAQQRLTGADEMGNLFKVLGLYPEQGPPLSGLTP